MRDLSKQNMDSAVFLPAISGFYTSFIENCKKGKHTLSPSFEHGGESLNFLDPDKGAYFYDKALYSAGHAQLDMDKCLDPSAPIDSIIHTRDRTRTLLLGDSGGFQIGTGVLKFDWARFYEKKGDANYKGDADRMRLAILQWLECTAEWSMVLDVPSWAANPIRSKATGLKTFEDCLRATQFNNEFFLNNRVGATKFLNVLQGSNWQETQAWYNAVKDYEFEGWAMGGSAMRNMYLTLKCIIMMRDQGSLEGKDWMHFLGTSKLEWAVMLTALQRQLRKHANPNLTVSFDCASPFISTANGMVYTSPIHTANRFSCLTANAPDNKMLKDSSIPFPFESEIGSRMTIGDICKKGPGENVNAKGEERKTSWDLSSYALIMAHNVYQHIRGVQIANHLTSIETARFKPDITQWKKLKKNDKSNEFSKWVPRNVLFFNQFLDDLFASTKPMQMLEDNKMFLLAVSGPRIRGKENNVVFSTLFDHSVDEMEDEEFTEAQTEKLIELEQGLDDA